MNKKGILVLAGILVVGLLAFGAFAAPFGNQEVKDALESGDFASWKEAMVSGLTEERFEEMRGMHENKGKMHEEMELAIAGGYSAFLELMESHPHGEKMLEVVTEENFDVFVQMHEARSSGDHETAKTLAAELGIENMRGEGRGMHRQGMNKGFGGCQG
jgi:hypothetical protein